MTNEERELSITYLEGIKEEYIEGEGYERHPLPEYYAIENAIKALADSIKAEKALERIKSLGLKDEITSADDALDEMKDYTVFEIADMFSEVSNLLCELRDLLESEET